jgi:hypothetical protein
MWFDNRLEFNRLPEREYAYVELEPEKKGVKY